VTSISLDGPWTLRVVDGEAPEELRGRDIAAEVPGCVHLDLHAAGLIAPPFDGDNESEQQWIGSTTWRYHRSFDWQPGDDDRHDLVAHGLDTLATVELNGRVVAVTQNQHRSFRWDVGHLLREGSNEIAVTFAAPVPEAERREREHGGARPHTNHHPYNALRKTASNFGWDWGPDVATSGIWRSIAVEGWSGVRIAQVRPLVDVVGADGVLTAHVDLQQDGLARDREVEVTVSRGGESWSASGIVRVSGAIRVRVPRVELWWPVGHGEPHRYDVTVRVAGDTWTRKVGFRTVEVDTTPDEHGTPFVLRVNDRPVQVRGANWIPDHAFFTGIDEARLRRRVGDAVEANMNLLRVWGGGMYESEALYEICSEQGVMVWQDFLFACAAYAEEPWLAQEVEAEAREQVARLSPHAALVLWCGNNENLWGYVEWGWRAELQGRTWGEGYYLDLLPRVVAELDPTRPYIPGSPFSPSPLMAPNDEANGTVHIWDVWNREDYTRYRDWRPRFVAEFGFQAPPAWTTLLDVVHDDPLDPYGHQLLVHQKAEDGNLKLERGYTPHFPPPRTFDDWHLTTQLNQAHAIRFGISHFRALAPYNTGTVVWQLNDNWPSVSWAAVDHAERRKPLWHTLRQVYAARFATVQPVHDGEGSELVILNDTDEPTVGEAVLRRLDLGGGTLAEARAEVTVPARGVVRVPIPVEVARPGDPGAEILLAQLPGYARVVHDYVDVVDQQLDPGALTATALTSADGAVITVTATSYVRDIVVLADRAHPDATVDDSMIALLPGESAELTVRAGGPLDPETVLAPTVLRSANQLRGSAIGLGRSIPAPAAGARL